MNNINIEKIKQTLKNTKKLALKKALPFILATSFVVGAGTAKAKAANVEFPTVSITYDDDTEYAKQGSYKSSYVTDKQAKEIYNIMEEIDEYFENIYNTMANGGMSVKHTKSEHNSMARFVASINEVVTNISGEFEDMTKTEQEIIKKYTESKVAECKLAYHDLTGISTKDLNDYAQNNNCVFVKSLNQGKIVNINVYKIKNNNIVESKIISIDDSKLSTTKTLVIVPEIEVIYSGSKPNFKTVYSTEIINKNDLKMYNQAVNDIEIFYSKLEKALDKGNYTKNKNQNNEDIFLSVYGDTNLVNQTINNKYQSYRGLKKVLNKYLNYKQDLLVSKVYNENSINYKDYIKYNANNTPIRISEENGFVYYQIDNEVHLVVDKGNIKTSDLKSSVSVLTNVKIKASTGLNIYIDGKLYEPTDVNGNVVEPFLYNGTTYLPARAISKVFNTNIEWKNGSIYMTTKENDGTYYIDENGNKVYLNSYSEIPSTNKVPGKQLIEKTLTGRKGIKIYFNGSLFTPTDVNGNVVETYIFNGTTYLPARAISNLFNADISWNRDLNGVVINRNQYIVNDNNGYYYEDENGDDVYVPEDEIDFGNTIVNKPYYIDENGNKVYIDEDDYQKTR